MFNCYSALFPAPPPATLKSVLWRVSFVSAWVIFQRLGRPNWLKQVTADIGTWRKETCVIHAVIKFLGRITLYFSNQNYTVFCSFFFKGKRNLSLSLLIFSSWKIKHMSLILLFFGLRISSVGQQTGLYLLASAENRQQHLTPFTCLLSSCWITKSSKSA